MTTAARTTTASLSDPISINGVEIPNRLAVAPMVTVMCDEEGQATERYIRYHEERAAGGWGLLITENYAVSPTGRGFWTAGLWNDEQISSHRDLTERVHSHGARIFAQIYHCGRQTLEAVIGTQAVSASHIPDPALGTVPRALAVPEIEEIIQQFGAACHRAKEAGFDGVELHGGHGYLIAQFMSLHANRRTDEYGGSLENRMRFPLEIIRAVRETCGEDFPVTFRISADERVPDGRTLPETLEIVSMLEEAGIDAIHVSTGTYGSAWSVIPPLNVDRGWIIDHAEAVKQVVNVPVITVGRINDPALAESVVETGRADMVAMGRQSLADADTPKKYFEGRAQEIRPCIGCQQGCTVGVFSNSPIRCMVNPRMGFEHLDESSPTGESKVVAVVGGGPAGMEAARTAAARGHSVHLYEKSDRLGGELLTGALPPGKGEFITYLTWSMKMLETSEVHVHLDTEFTPEICREIGAEHIVVATGAVAARPGIPGLDHPHVVTATEVLTGKAAVGTNVVVAGGGLIGSETATYVADIPGRSVAVVEMLPDIAVEEEPSRKLFLMKMIAEKGIAVHASTTITGITPTAVAATSSDGSAIELPADTVVLALGMNPVPFDTSELEDVEITTIGDAIEARDAVPAIREGFVAGCEI